MKFGPVPLAEAEGAILAHSVAISAGRLRKGTALTASDLAALAEAGVESVTVAQLDPDDVGEAEAAARLAAALAPDPGAAHLRLTRPTNGRVNLVAEGPGVAVMDAERLRAVNRIDPMISLATVPPLQQMRAGGLVATVKIISYAVPGAALARAEATARGALSLAPPVLRSAGLIITDVPGGPGDKGAEAIAGRLEALGVTLASTQRCAHDPADLAAALAAAQGDLILILTGSATSDPYDVAPQGLRQAGGHVTRFGMPVDPGNLLFLGALGARPVIGLPGCARSPALNGADWVLSRIVCGIDVSTEDIADMGVGGLLKEIPTRPMPRRSPGG